METKRFNGIEETGEKCIDCDQVRVSEREDVEQDTVETPKTMAEDKTRNGDSGSREDKADAATKKYESSLAACKPHEKRYFEGPIKEHMLKRFGEDRGFCEDFLQKHKTFQKCIKYLIEKAKESVPKSEMQAMVEGAVYLEWMEDYFRKDDKAEEEEKAKEAAERKKKQEERVKKAKAEPKKAEDPKPKEEVKPKKNNKRMDGQLDMFSIMGM